MLIQFSSHLAPRGSLKVEVVLPGILPQMLSVEGYFGFGSAPCIGFWFEQLAENRKFRAPMFLAGSPRSAFLKNKNGLSVAFVSCVSIT